MKVIGSPSTADMDFLADKLKQEYLSNLINSQDDLDNIMETKFQYTSKPMLNLI